MNAKNDAIISRLTIEAFAVFHALKFSKIVNLWFHSFLIARDSQCDALELFCSAMFVGIMY